MKRILIILTAFLLAIPTFSFAEGENTFRTAGDLFQYWAGLESFPMSPYPDYVTGVWSTDGSTENLTFGVTEDAAGEAGKEEILSLIEDDSTVSFAYQTFPHRELMEIYGKLVSDLGSDTGAYGMGVYEMENCVMISIDVSAPGAEAFMEECLAVYGDRVAFEEGEGITITAEAGVDTGGAVLREDGGLERPQLLPFVLAAALLLLGAGGALLLGKRKRAGDGAAQEETRG